MLITILILSTIHRLAILAFINILQYHIPLFDTSPTLISQHNKYRWDAIHFKHIEQNGYTNEKLHAFYPGISIIKGVVNGNWNKEIIWNKNTSITSRIHQENKQEETQRETTMHTIILHRLRTTWEHIYKTVHNASDHLQKSQKTKDGYIGIIIDYASIATRTITHIVKESDITCRYLYRRLDQAIRYLAGDSFDMFMCEVSSIDLDDIISLVAHLIAISSLYNLTHPISPALARSASILYAIGPATIFGTALYTESIFNALTFAALSMGETSLLRGVLFFGASMVRSNGILHSGFGIQAFMRTRRFSCLINAVSPLLPHVLLAYYASSLYCPGASWCDDVPIPGIYSYVQREYWNNGFLSYWTLNQLPMWIIALPMLIFSFAGSGLWIRRHLQLSAVVVPSSAHMILWTFLTLYLTFFMHVQVSWRVFGSLCGVWWFGGWLCNEGGEMLWGPQSSSTSKSSSLILCISLYAWIGGVLFMAFLPPA